MKNYIFIFLLFSMQTLLGQEQASFEVKAIYKAGDGTDYYNYRVPSLVSTSKGTLLAFCAARKGTGGDWDPIDIVLRRSTDSGKTWSKTQVIVHKEGLPCDNATPIVDYRNNIIHLVFQISYKNCYYIKSEDDGKTWTEPVDITYAAIPLREKYPWVIIAPGPGHGIQLSGGRLIVPVWISDGGGEEAVKSGKIKHRPSVVSSLFSDDYGKTWQSGDIAVPDNDTIVIPNETSCIELVDGRVMFNSRNESINYRRVITYSPDGQTGWSKSEFADSFFEPICFASMCRFSKQPLQDKNRILFCNPDSRYNPWVASKKSTPRSALNRRRSNLTVRMSYDEGLTWPVSKTITPGIAGYSDLAVTPDGLIHCLFENGSMQGNEGNHYKTNELSIATFNLNWLTNGNDSLDKKEIPLKMYTK